MTDRAELRALARALVERLDGTFWERDAEGARLIREAVLERAHEAGGTFEEVAARLGLTKVKLSQLRMEHPELAERFPFKRGRKKASPDPTSHDAKK